MKTALCFAALAATSAIGAAPNLLFNPDLELFPGPPASETISGWSLIEPDQDINGASVNSASFMAFANHTPGGSRGLWLRSYEGGLNGDAPPTVNAIFYQTLPAVPAREYILSAWFKFEANYSSAATPLTIEFLDEAFDSVGGASIDINELNPKDAVWREFSINATAGPQATFVRVGISMVDGSNAGANPQSAMIDDFYLSDGTEPCKADLNGDGIVNSVDLNILLANYGCIGFNCPGDINDGGNVNSVDLNILLSNYGCGT